MAEIKNLQFDDGVAVTPPSGASDYFRKNKYDATVDPTVDEDSDDGYSVGSQWINVTDDKAFVLLDSTVGAAIWQELGSGGAGTDTTIKLIRAFSDGVDDFTQFSVDTLLVDPDDTTAFGANEGDLSVPSTGSKAFLSNDDDHAVVQYDSESASQYSAFGILLNIPRGDRGKDILQQMFARTEDDSGDSTDNDYLKVMIDMTNMIKLSASANEAIGQTTLSVTEDPTAISTFDFVDGDVSTGDDTITETAHGYKTGFLVQLTTTTTLPAGLSTSTDYYVIRVDANTIKLATSEANAKAGTAVDITSAASGGTHTISRRIKIGSPISISCDSDVLETHVTAITSSTIDVADALVSQWSSGVHAIVDGMLTDQLTYINESDSDVNKVAAVDKLLALIPENCEQIYWGIQQITSQTDSQLYIDNILFSRDPFKKATTQGVTEAGYFSTSSARGSTNTNIPYYTSESGNLGKVLSYTNDSTSGLTFTALQKCEVNITYTYRTNGAQGINIVKNGDGTNSSSHANNTGNGVSLARTDSITNEITNIDATAVLEKGDTIFLVDAATGTPEVTDSQNSCSITATPLQNQSMVVESTDAVISDPTTQSGITIGATTTAPSKATTTELDEVSWHREGKFMVAEYKYRATDRTGATAGSGDYLFKLPDGYYMDESYVDFYTTVEGAGALSYGGGSIIGDATVDHGSVTWRGVCVAYDSSQFRVAGGYFSSTSATGTGYWCSVDVNLNDANYNHRVMKIKVPIAGWSATPAFQPLLSLPTVTYGQEPEHARFHTRGDSDGRASTNTNIVYFANEVENTVSNLATLANSATLGFSVTATQRCKITITWSCATSAAGWFGFSKNSTQLSTAYTNITDDDQLASSYNDTATGSDHISYTGILEPGDVIRPHIDALTMAANAHENVLSVLLEPIQGVTNQAAIISSPTMYIDLDATNYKPWRTATTGYQDIPLVALKGEIAAVGGSIASNHLTLPAGKYELELPVGGYNGTTNTSLLIYNETDSVDIEEFLYVTYAFASEASMNIVKTSITLTKTTEISFQYKSGTASGEEWYSRFSVKRVK